MSKCLDPVNKSEHVKGHQGHRKLRLQKQITRFFFIFCDWNGQTELAAILVPGKVSDHNWSDGERYEPNCDKHNPDKPVDLLQKLHVQSAFLDEAFGVEDEEEAESYAEEESDDEDGDQKIVYLHTNFI